MNPLILKLISCCLLLLLPQTGESQSTNKAPQKHSLWKAKGKKNTVHFLGSIHFLREEMYPLSAPIENAYSNSPIIYFELDIDEMNKPAAAAKMLQRGSYEAGKSIKDDLSKETYEALKEKAKKTLGQPTALDRFKPSMAAVTLLTFELMRLGFNPADGIDKHYFGRARSDQKERRALETLDDQLNLFFDLSKEQQENFLKSTLKDIGDLEKIFKDLVDAWEKGDTERIDKLINDAMKDYPDLIEKFLTQRNKAWVKKIETALEEDKNVLVIVGAGHLVGKGSLLDLLKATGISIEQVSSP